MSETLSDFLHRRASELAAEERDLRVALDLVKDEQDQLYRAAQAAGVAAATAVSIIESVVPLPKPGRAARRGSERTMKEVAVEIVRDRGRPMTATDMLPLINERLGTDYPRSSLSPQLSRLKVEGRLVLEGKLWRLPDGGPEKNEAAGDAPSGDAPAASITGSVTGASDQPEAQGREAVSGKVVDGNMNIFN